MVHRAYGVATYYIPDGDGFDPAITSLLPQAQRGLAVNIHRLDGVQVRLSVREMPLPLESEAPYWHTSDTVACQLCEAAWKAGYHGLDAGGGTQVAICLDCADSLLEMQLSMTRVVSS